MMILFLFFAVSWAYDPSDELRQAGSGSNLTGSVTSLICFLSTADNQWTSAEKQHMLNILQEAESWLTRQASRYQIQLSFQQHIIEQTVIVKQLKESHAHPSERVDWASRIQTSLGFQSQREFARYLRQNNIIHNYHLLVFAKAQGISYSMAYTKNMSAELYFLETSILYRSFPNQQPLPAASIAHEILHVYGAWDYYTTFQQSAERQQIAETIFPNDIMLRVSYDMEQLSVTPLTAWRIGWTQLYWDWYDWFRPRIP